MAKSSKKPTEVVLPYEPEVMRDLYERRLKPQWREEAIARLSPEQKAARQRLLDLIAQGKARKSTPETIPKPNSTGMMSAADLAKAYGLSRSTVSHRLKRWRKQNGMGWIEVNDSERLPRDPKYLYNQAAVESVLKASD